MGKIKILSDRDGVYQVGSIIDVMQFIQAYIDHCNDKSTNEWLCVIPIPSAVNFIAEAWGIEYEFV